MRGVLAEMSVVPEVGHCYWIRLYRDDAPWEPARRARSENCMTVDYCWLLFGGDCEYYDTEVNEIGPEIILPPA